ncbi:polysaccharide export protein [Novosphingobium profundi]|uniref:polysaccharide biosynthesis/export family protein n=1 Tax=Novosphingobium profundi TaxID=1774954 RepID=UPI001BD98AED|nr:polysaccharide biosynthesis/export family protein [Novosphingobium profundi]MBT0668697.1 polysaccharide export protein [Novosphingobium profundi]
MPRPVLPLSLLVIAGLALPAGPASSQASATVQAAAASQPGSSPDGLETYHLGPGDKLRITVFNVADISGEYAVSSSGLVAIPLLGAIRADGETTQSLTAAIRAGLAGTYIKDPRVTVEIVDYRPFYILGEVNHPGEFSYKPNLTLEQAVATAGGYTYRAARKKAFLRRAGKEEEIVRFGQESKVVYVLPGDTIRIGERYF